MSTVHLKSTGSVEFESVELESGVSQQEAGSCPVQSVALFSLGEFVVSLWDGILFPEIWCCETL